MRRACLFILMIFVAVTAYSQYPSWQRKCARKYVRPRPYLPSGAPTNGLEAEYVQGNWHMADATHIDTWYDSSRANSPRFLLQPSGAYQPHLLQNGRADFFSASMGGYGGHNYDVATACYATGETTFVIRGLNSSGRNTSTYKFMLTFNATPQPLLFAVNDSDTRFKTFSPSGAWEGNTVYPGAPNGGAIKTFAWMQTNGVKKEWFDGTSVSTLNTSDSTFTAPFNGIILGGGLGNNPQMEIQDVFIYSRILSEAEIKAIRDLP